MKKNKRVQVRQAGDHTIVVITLLFLVALAVAPLLWGLYFERELLLIGTAVLACCLTLFVQLIRKNALRFDYLDGLFLFLCLCFFISLGNAASLREAYLGALKFIIYFSCYYIVRSCFLKQEEKTLVLKVIVFSLTAMSLLTILTQIGVLHIPNAIVGKRFSGTLQYANTFAVAMILAVSLTYYLDMSADEKQRPLFLLLNYLNTAAFFASASRGAFIIYLPLMILYLVFWRNKNRFFVRLLLVNMAAAITSILMFSFHGAGLFFIIVGSGLIIYLLDKLATTISSRRQVIIATGVILLGGALVLVLAPGSPIMRITKIDLSSVGAVARFVFYEDAWKSFQTSPLIGRGADAWEYLYRSIQTYYYNTKLVHSNLFQLLVEVGLLGTLAYYALFVLVGLKNIKAFYSEEHRLEMAVLLALLAIQLHALIDFDLSMPAITLFVFALLGLLAGEYGEGKIKLKFLQIPSVLLVALSLVSCVSFLIAGVGVDEVIAEVKDGHVQVKKIQQHQDKLRFAALLDPLNAYYKDYLGQYLIIEGTEKNDGQKISEGLQRIDQAIRLSPNDYHLYIDKGKMLVQLGRYDEASCCFEQLISLMPYHQTGYDYLSRNYTVQAFATNEPVYAEKALAVYQLAEDNFGKIPQKYLNMIPEEDIPINSETLNFQIGAAYFMLEKYEEGLRHFAVAQKYNTKEDVAQKIDAWIALGNERLGRDPELDDTVADPAILQEVEKLLNGFHQGR